MFTSFASYHPLVKTLLIGNVIVSVIQSMAVPYFAIYLSIHTELHISTIGLIIGLGALSGTFGGFLGGMISDWLGRKFILICSLLMLAVANFGYVVANNAWVISTLILFAGFFGAFFGPTAKALIADATAPESRIKVFSMQYVGTNLGYVIGPLLGVALGVIGGTSPFLIMGGVYVVYIFLLSFLFGLFPVPDSRTPIPSQPSQTHVLRVLRSDKILILFVLGGVVTSIVHARWSAPMSIFLTQHLPHGAAIFSILLTTNAVVVVLVQPFAAKSMEKLQPIASIAIGGSLFALGCIIFALSGTALAFVFGMVVFTVGEVFMMPSEYTIIDQITPIHLRGAYYGAANLTTLGSFIGPWLCTFLLSRFNGIAMFMAMTVFSVLSIGIYFYGWRRHTHSQIDNQDTGINPKWKVDAYLGTHKT